MYTCAHCGVVRCRTDPELRDLPANCPIRDGELIKKAKAHYDDPAVREFFVVSSEIEAEGYCRWPRLRETVEFCNRLGYKKIGMAFCSGLQREARVIAGIFKNHGLDIVSVICKCGGIPKEEAGISDEKKVRPGTFEPMCNSIGQALLLNSQQTEFNILVGLCVGHDSLFTRHSDALCTTLITKDRALGHNPIAAVYGAEGYMKKRLSPDEA